MIRGQNSVHRPTDALLAAAQPHPIRSRGATAAFCRPTLSIAFPALLFVSLCGGCASVSPIQSATTTPTTPTTPAAPTTPSVSEHLVLLPESLTIRHDESWNFIAAMAQVASPVVTHLPITASWSVQEGAAGGSITADGVYTAPSVEGVYHVVGTSTTDPTSTATTVVTVGPGLELSGDTEAARVLHTETLLPNGQVIVAGGFSYSCVDLQSQLIVDRADQYDPATGVFQFVANVTRSGHTATLLPNGDLLFLGGYTTIVPSGPNVNPVTPVPAATAEILKAGTGTIQPASEMSIARAGHTATLLQDGRILITGGYTPLPYEPPFSDITSSAELYDPVSGTSSPVGSMSVARANHFAILLLNGKVLIIGGSAELYDPSTNSFTPTGSPTLQVGLPGSTATLLPDGRVLLAGGWILDPSYYPYVSVDTAELYDPATGQFTTAGKMTIARSSHTATLLPNGTVLIAGGLTSAPTPNDDEPPTGATEIFDPQTNTFSPGHAMKTPHEGHTATLLLDGTILFVGGSWNNPNIGAEIFH
jgi:Galactose oxidase, central domain